MIIDFRINFQIFSIIFQTVVKYYPIELIVILDMITDTEMKDLILKFARGWGGCTAAQGRYHSNASL